MASPYPSSRPGSRGPASPSTNQYSAPAENATCAPAPRFMQVKVLYTFDGESKTNCLARCRQPLMIQTVNLDGHTQIGIVELRTCIDAIISGSPELIPKLGHDYTVYAYDYSEYETPLVGQGMLSRVLAAASTTPMAPAHESRTMVTGRVCRNVLGFFSDGIKETLEVKLKLVPVPTRLQDEYVSGMEKYRDPSNLIGEDIDEGAWSDFMKANPSLSAVQNLNSEPSHPSEDRERFSNQVHTADQTKAAISAGQDKFALRDAQPHNQFICYGPPPPPNAGRTTPLQQPRPKLQSRPSSRASNRGQAGRRQSVSDAQGAQGDEGPAKKRARTTKANWNGVSAFGQNPDSLRVAASTAASMRGLTSTPIHPSASDIAAGDFGNRPPTPRPDPVIPKKQRGGLKRSKTALAHDAITHSTFDHASPKSADVALPESAIAMSSPEKDGSSVASTPFDMPSSPPVMPATVSPSPSSPALPQLRHHPDSGFASGTPDECFDTDIDDPGTLDENENRDGMRRNRRSNTVMSDLSITEEVPGDPNLLPRRILPRPAPRRKLQPIECPESSPKLPPLRHVDSHVGNDTGENPQSTIGAPAWPGIGATTDQYLPRENIQVANSSSVADESTGITAQGGSGLRRKRTVQSALRSSIAAGEMPRYCKNCGEIDTPTWRKAYVRVEDGSPDHLQVSENDDGITACEILDKDENGTVTSYRVIKKSVIAEEKDLYEEIPLCNPCGMWLYKQKSMRPYEVWNKAAIEAAKPKPKPVPKKRKSFAKEKNPDSEAGDIDARPTLSRNNSSKVHDEPTANPAQEPPEPPRKTSRSGSVDLSLTTSLNEPLLDEAAAAAALKKAFQSSPPRFPGSKTSPIHVEADLTPQPTRRTLFPSPRRPGEIKSLEKIDVFASKSAPPSQVADDKDVVENEKENLVDGGKASTPATPKSGASTRDMLKTPSISAIRKALTPRGFLSSAARRWRDGPETPSRISLAADGNAEMTPFTAQLCQLLFDANQSPSRGNDVSALFGEQTANDQSAAFAFSDFSVEDFTADMHLNGSAHGALPLYEDSAMDSDALWNSEALLDSSTFDELVGDGAAMSGDTISDAPD